MCAGNNNGTKEEFRGWPVDDAGTVIKNNFR